MTAKARRDVGAASLRRNAAAIEVCRPLPYIAASPVRARDIAAELFKRAPEVK